MYQVIARTWRPQKFSEVIGQKHVTQTLQNAIRLNRIGHGYIFSGQRGVGKTTVARLLAKALNCQRGPAPEPCGECDSCREVAAGRSVDVIEIDAASNRGIDAVRELRENARYAPARDRYKIFIIDEAHQITPEGFNALLKTLEEPPEHVVFLLATTEAHQFPETILSRCQHFSLHALTFAEILGHLGKVCASEKVEADSEALAVLAKSGQGSLRDSLSRLEQAIAAFGPRLEGPALRRFLGEPPSSLMEQVILAIKQQNREAMLAVVEKLVEEGYQLPHFCSQLVRAVRNLLVIRVAGSEPRLLESLVESTAEEIQRLAALAEGFTEESLMRSLAILLQLHQELRYTMEPRFQMELGLLKLVDAEKLVAIEDLLAQLQGGPEASLTQPQSASPARSDTHHAGTGPRHSGPGALGWKPGPPKGAESSVVFSGSGQGNTGNQGQADQFSRSTPVVDESRRSGKLSPLEQDLRRKKQFPESSGHAEVSPTGAGAATAVVASQPTVTELSPEEQRWIEEILQRLEEQARPFLASILPVGSGWQFTESGVQIRLAEEGLVKAIQDSDRQYLERICSAVLARDVRVSFGQGEGIQPLPARGRGADIRQAGWNQPVAQTPSDSAIAQEAAGERWTVSAESRVRQDPEVAQFERVFRKRVEVIRTWKE